MSRAAFRGLAVLLLSLGVVLALLGAARLGHSGTSWQSQPLWPLFVTGLALQIVAALLLRLYRPADRAGSSEQLGTLGLLAQLRSALVALQDGRAPTHSAPGALPAALLALVEAAAPTEEAPYLLWLKLQLDPLIDELFPALFATRWTFQKEHGVVAYGTIFSQLARAERLLSRAWSAAVDGYGEEARQSLADALEQVGEVTW